MSEVEVLVIFWWSAGLSSDPIFYSCINILWPLVALGFIKSSPWNYWEVNCLGTLSNQLWHRLDYGIIWTIDLNKENYFWQVWHNVGWFIGVAFSQISSRQEGSTPRSVCLVRTLEMLGSVQFSVMPRTQTLIDLTAGLLPRIVTSWRLECCAWSAAAQNRKRKVNIVQSRSILSCHAAIGRPR